MRANECSTLRELMSAWKSKDPFPARYIREKENHEIMIDHQRNFFVSDGIVDEMIWNDLPYNKRVLFILKEAYDTREVKQEWSLTEHLKSRGPYANIWYRVCEWTYGIMTTTSDHIEPYSDWNAMRTSDVLRKISVMNIKKSDGLNSSKQEEISAYADADAEEIIREIVLIDPYIVICGSTFADINRITGNQITGAELPGTYAYTDIIGGKERLFVNFYHPANHFPSFMNYYGMAGVYQQALNDKLRIDMK